MNSKFPLIGSLSVLTVIGLFFASVSTDEVTPSEMNTDIVLIPSTQEFLKMDCKELEHIFPEFPSVEVADAWNTRMHECINEQESLQLETSMPVIDKGIIAEMGNLQQMSCDEIIQRNTEGEYLGSENRKFAREKVSPCVDKQESPIRYGHCSTILIIAQTQLNFYTNDAKDDLINRIHDCIIDNEFSLSDVLQTYQIQMCKLYQEIENIPACNDISITTQPFSESIPTDELYAILVENERKEINSIECSELVKKYDGKMHTIFWNVHRELISNAMDKCKDNSSMIGN